MVKASVKVVPSQVVRPSLIALLSKQEAPHTDAGADSVRERRSLDPLPHRGGPHDAPSMAWSALPIPRRLLPARSVRQIAATTQADIRQAAERLLGVSLDLVVNSLAERQVLYRLVDQIIDYLSKSTALYRLVNDIVDYIAVNPSVRDLVQSQGAHLTDEMIDESRERLFRADEMVDRVVSSARRRLHVPQRRARPTQRLR
jgi:hypothetical protein